MMLVTTWGQVSSTTILNCFRHEGLETEREEFDKDDSILLNLWIEKLRKNKEMEDVTDLNE